MDIFLEALIGAIVWALANVIYVDLRRKGVRKGRMLRGEEPEAPSQI